MIISSYNPDARQTSGNIYDFMEEFERLGGKAPIALENLNCKMFSEAPLWKNKMEELLAKYRGKRSPVLLVLIGQEAWISLFITSRFHTWKCAGAGCTGKP